MKRFIAAFVVVLLLTAPVCGAATQEELATAEGLRQNAIEFFRKGNYSQAIQLLREALKLDPRNAAASRQLRYAKELLMEPYCKQAAEAYQDADFKKAVEIWEKIAKMNPDDDRIPALIILGNTLNKSQLTRAFYQNAEKYVKDKKYGLAIAELEKILSLAPDDARAAEMLSAARKYYLEEQIRELYELAEVYEQQSIPDLAIEKWKKILELDPKQEKASRLIAEAVRTKLEAFYGQAKQRYEDGDYVAAREIYGSVITQNPTDIDVQTMLDRLEKTIKVVPTVKEKGQAWDMVRKSLALHISANGNATAAVVAVRYAEQLDPENKRITMIREFVEQERLAVVRSMPPVSTEMNIIEQYLASSLNRIYDGRFDLAADECIIVLELQPQNVLALKRLGSSYFAMGKKGKALETWNKALKLSPGDADLKEFIGKGR